MKCRRLAAIASVAVVTTALAACSSSGSSKGGDGTTAASTASAVGGGTSSASGDASLAEAQAFLAPFLKIPTGIVIDTPLSKLPPRGKLIIGLTNGGSSNVEFDATLKQAAEAFGWTFKEIQEGTTAEAMQAAVQSAIDQHPAGITYSGIPNSTLAKQLKNAADAGIPVVVSASTDKIQSPPQIDNTLASPEAAAKNGKALAAEVAIKSGGKAHVALMALPVYPILTAFDVSFKSALASYCPSCTVTTYNQQLSDIGKNTPSAVVSAIQAHPDTNWVIFDLGDVADGVSAALRSAGLAKKISIAGSVPTPADLAGVKSGSETAWVLYDTPAIGYRIADDFARKFNGDDLSKVVGQDLPDIVVTSDNVGDLTLGSDGSWAGVTGAFDQFKKLWGLS